LKIFNKQVIDSDAKMRYNVGNTLKGRKNMNISENIYNLRKASGLTQEALAEKLSISFQAVSKWENGQSLPDITMLPLLAEIFSVTTDALFGRNAESCTVSADSLPWSDDGKIRGMVFKGRQLLKSCDDLSGYTFIYEGDADNVESNCTVNCGDVAGNVSAGVSVSCGEVCGSVYAGTDVNCGDVCGGVNAGVSVTCGDVGGAANAGVSMDSRG
jgi:transcriptional regulator with XRE-family HTH domain